MALWALRGRSGPAKGDNSETLCSKNVRGPGWALVPWGALWGRGCSVGVECGVFPSCRGRLPCSTLALWKSFWLSLCLWTDHAPMYCCGGTGEGPGRGEMALKCPAAFCEGLRPPQLVSSSSSPAFLQALQPPEHGGCLEHTGAKVLCSSGKFSFSNRPTFKGRHQILHREMGHSSPRHRDLPGRGCGAGPAGTETSPNAFLLTLGLNLVPNPKSLFQMGLLCHNYY